MEFDDIYDDFKNEEFLEDDYGKELFIERYSREKCVFDKENRKQ